MNAFVVDANAISEFQRERATSTSVLAVPSMEHLLSHGFIAVDENDGSPIILHEWLECASHKNSQYALQAWIDDQMQMGKIRLFLLCKNSTLNSRLKSFGLSGRDTIYIRLASCIPAHSIISNDIDFHDPAEKAADPARRLRIMRSKKGAVCKHVRDTYSVNIIDWEEVPLAVP